MTNSPAPEVEFPIVGIGASAGGLEAFIQLINQVPLDSAMAYILIQHLSPDHPSLSVEIISKSTKLPVSEVQDKMRVEVNHIYVIPPNHSMKIENGSLLLLPRPEGTSQHMSIDVFFESLALAKKGQAIGVLLSGTGSDGTLGLRAIQGIGGITCVQDPKNAKFNGMPNSAIAAGVVDFILPANEIAHELSRLALDLSSSKLETDETLEVKSDDEVNMIFDQLRTHTNVDFSNYKFSTINRRIQRRILLLKLKNIKSYSAFLRDHPKEINALYNDLLINVTEFFRDPDSFTILSTLIFPELLLDRTAKEPIRIWIPGCSTGEEVYSIAITLLEYLAKVGGHNTIQIFATDISDVVLKKARTGFYPISIEQNVSPKRLADYFDKINDGYKVRKSIRDICVFSHHDMTRDPPIAKLDMISCRNVLIYFGASLQKRIIPIFHYALKPHGYLWLGKSETTNGHLKLFQVEDKTHKFYSKKMAQPPVSFHFPKGSPIPSTTTSTSISKRIPIVPTADFQVDADKIILSKFSPPGVVVNSDMEVLQIRGSCSLFLEPSLNNNLFKMIRTELLTGLRSIVLQVKKKNTAIMHERLQFKNQSKIITLNLEMLPINPQAELGSRNYLILFEILRESRTVSNAKGTKKDFRETQIAEIIQELNQTKESQQILTEQHEAAQEELSAANEELQSANEELQSTNEELETAKEELQSTNEELVTVNDELQIRNNDLTTLGNDLSNLLSSTEIPILMIGADKNIRRFTPEAEKAFNIIATDIGRPISDIKSNFGIDLTSLIDQVIATLTPLELEVQDQTGSWKRLQIRSYKTVEKKIDGVIISLDDIDLLKRKEKNSKDELNYVSTIANTVPFPIAVLDNNFKLKSANSTFYNFFQKSKEVLDQDIFITLSISKEYLPPLRKLFSQTIESSNPIKDFEMEIAFPPIGLLKFHLSGGKVHWKETGTPLVLLSFVDITERSRIEEQRNLLLIKEQEARSEAEKANNAKDIFLATLSHELRTPLSAILPWAQLIQMGKLDTEKMKYGAAIIEQSVKVQSQLIDDLLDVSRMIVGKLSMEIKEVNLADVIRMAVESVQELAKNKSIQIATTLSPESNMILGDQVRLQQIIWNLLTNAIKFSPHKSKIEIRLQYIDKDSKRFAKVTVSDSGKGIPEIFLPYIFNRFSQADGASTRLHGGLGLGLSIVQKLVELQGGNIRAENMGEGKGALFTINFPLSMGKNAIKPLNSTELPHGKLSVYKEQPRLDGLHILFVDDQENVREAIKIYLNSFGAEVIAVNSVEEALGVLSSNNLDIVITDLAMPFEDGYALIEKIRALPAEFGGILPVVALSAYGAPEDFERTKAAGFQALVSKPVEANELGKVILQFTKQKPSTT